MDNSSRLFITTLLCGLMLWACKKTEEQPPPQPYAQPYGQQPPAYPQAQPQPAPQTTVGTAPTAAQPGGTLSTPGPAALPCQTDANCLTAKCNTAYGKCVFPCQNDNDCIPPNQCVLGTGLCVPSLGGVGTGGTPGQ